MSNQLAGGYSPFTSDISAEASAAFEVAMKSIIGVKYTPVAVSTQVVSGLNYAFFCNAEIPGYGGVYPAMVSIYAPLEGDPVVTHIGKVSMG